MILNPSSLFFSDISDVEVEERDESDEDEGFGSSVKRVLEKELNNQETKLAKKVRKAFAGRSVERARKSREFLKPEPRVYNQGCFSLLRT